jgi:hypothetical protein
LVYWGLEKEQLVLGSITGKCTNAYIQYVEGTAYNLSDDAVITVNWEEKIIRVEIIKIWGGQVLTTLHTIQELEQCDC